MANTYYGARSIQQQGNEEDMRYDAVGNNSEVFATYDIVTANSGNLEVQNTTETVWGVVLKTQTMTSDNETVAVVRPGYIPADDRIWLMGTNSDLAVATGPGTYYKLTGVTGTQQVDVASGVQTGANRVVEIVKVDPFSDGGTGSGSGLRIAYVRFVKTPYTNVTITA